MLHSPQLASTKGVPIQASDESTWALNKLTLTANLERAEAIVNHQQRVIHAALDSLINNRSIGFTEILDHYPIKELAILPHLLREEGDATPSWKIHSATGNPGGRKIASRKPQWNPSRVAKRLESETIDPPVGSCSVLAGFNVVIEGDFGSVRPSLLVGAWIEAAGGTVDEVVDATTTHLVASRKCFEEGSQNVRKCIQLHPVIRIVTLDWLEDTILCGKVQNETPYLWRRVKVKEDRLYVEEVVSALFRHAQEVKLAREDLSVGNPGDYHIYTGNDGFEYNITLTRVDVESNRNERYLIRIYESHTFPRAYYTVAIYCRTDEKNRRQRFHRKTSFLDALYDFARVFHYATHVRWRQRLESRAWENADAGWRYADLVHQEVQTYRLKRPSTTTLSAKRSKKRRRESLDLKTPSDTQGRACRMSRAERLELVERMPLDAPEEVHGYVTYWDLKWDMARMEWMRPIDMTHMERMSSMPSYERKETWFRTRPFMWKLPDSKKAEPVGYGTVSDVNWWDDGERLMI